MGGTSMTTSDGEDAVVRIFYCEYNEVGMVEIWKDTGECGGPSDLTMTIDEYMPNGGSAVCTETPCDYTTFSGYVKNTSTMSSAHAFTMNDFGFNDMLQPDDYECPDESDGGAYWTIALVMGECMVLSDSLSAVYECYDGDLVRTFYDNADCFWPIKNSTTIDYGCLQCASDDVDDGAMGQTVKVVVAVVLAMGMKLQQNIGKGAYTVNRQLICNL